MSDTVAAQHVAERLYYDLPDLTFAARVTDIRLIATAKADDGTREQLWQLALDRTAFYPESGGQPWDTGVLVAKARSGAVLEVPVERVEEDDAGEVWHFVRKPLVEGTEVEGRVDAARRMDHMQQHSGQHLLSAVFLSLMGARTVSFHLGAESSTIDLTLPEGTKEIAPARLVAVEVEVNRLVLANRRVCPRWHARAEADAMLARGELRKLPDRSGPMRVVEMEGVEFNACGGTHVTATGAIGGVLLRGLEKVKAGWRVEFVCGLRAVQAARRDFETLSLVAGTLSVGTGDVPGRIRSLQEETKANAKERRGLLDELAEARAAELLRSAGEHRVLQAVFAGRPIEFAKRMSLTIAKAGRIAVMAYSQAQNGGIVLALPQSDTRHAGNLLQEVCLRMGVRGGGSPELAQAICEAGSVPGVMAALMNAL